MPGPTVAVTIERFTPRSVSDEVAAFARTVVHAADPHSPTRAKALLFAASKLGSFGCGVGLPLDHEVLLTESVIERFAGSRQAGGRATARTLRSNLRHLAQTVPRYVVPRPQPLPRDRAKAPYSAAEISGYLALADVQGTSLRRRRGSALICLGAGAGLVGAELRRVRGHDVVARSGGVLVIVTGRRPRAVPVLTPYHDRLMSVAASFGPGYLVSGPNPDSHNVTNPLLAALSATTDRPRLEPARLRATYLVDMARAIGLRAFMDAAGITCSQHLGDLVRHLDAPDEAVAVARLGARR